MIRRLVLMVAAAVVAAGVAAPAAVADADATNDPAPVTLEQAERYWACVAVGYVNVGTCVSNPLPDLSQYPTVPDTIHDLTGIRLPSVPRP